MFSRFKAAFFFSFFSRRSLSVGRLNAALLATLLIGAIVILPTAQAASNDLPTRTEVQNQLDALHKQKSLTPVDKLSEQDLIRTTELLDALERVKQEETALKEQLANAPAKLEAAANGISQLKSNSDDSVTKTQLSALSMHQL